MAYTPSTQFKFPGGDYTPTTSFVFVVNSGDLSAVLDDTVGSFTGYVPPAGFVSATLDDTTGSFIAAVAPQGVLSATLDDTAGSFVARNVANSGSFSVTLEDTVGGFIGEYDPNVHRFTVSDTLSSQQDAFRTIGQFNLTRDQATYLPNECASTQQQTLRTDTSIQALLATTTPIVIDVGANTDEGSPLTETAQIVFEKLTPLDYSLSGYSEQASPVYESAVAGFDELLFTSADSAHPVQDSGLTIHDVTRLAWGDPPLEHRYTPSTNFSLSGTEDYSPAAPFVWDYVVPSVVILDTQQRGVVRLENDFALQRATKLGLHICSIVQEAMQPWTGGNSTWTPGGTVYPPNPPPVDPPGHITLTIPTQSAYIMQHTLSVTLVDLTPISMESVSLSLDADSFAWQFSGTLLDKADLANVQQVDSNPVQLIITINGYEWKVLVERIEHSRQFVQKTITLSGRGLTALLGQPYEQPASATQSSDLTVQQLAELQLPIDWEINWTATTWVVPSGAYSYNGQTPIQALATLASDIGAMMVPSRNSQVINIMPRYPVLPWYFNTLSPDVTIPEAVITQLSQRPVIPYQANGVYVHGTEIGGALAWCHLEGTDGARLAPTVSNALMTDAIGCRALGERIIAGQYAQPAIRSLSVPMDGTIVPLLEVGQFAEITVDSQPVRGIINSVQIEAKLDSVRQTIQIGEETPNTWAMFKELLPRDPLLVATLAETDGSTSLMTLLDNGVVRVRGTGTVGGKYYIRSGRIDGEAPNLTQDEIVL